jgi:putative transposase
VGLPEEHVRARLQPCRRATAGGVALAAEGMSTPKRHESMPGTYFVTSRTWESRALFIHAEPCRIFVESLLHYRQQGAYLLHAFVLMPDHFHLLITPATNKTMERAIQYVKGGSARRLSLERNMHFPVRQRGFSDHRVRDGADYESHVHYIGENPVRKKLVETAKEYLWSSASGSCALDGPPQGLKPQERGEQAIVRHG